MDIKSQLRYFAEKYEAKDFIDNSPVMFPRRFCVDSEYGRFVTKKDAEICGFITAWLSYGKLEQIKMIAHRLFIFMQYKPYDYLMSRKWEEYIGDKERLNRFLTYGDYAELLSRLYDMYNFYGDLEAAVEKCPSMEYISALKMLFNGIKGIPEYNSRSACNRLAMFLRWMIRKNSPVDLGIWEKCSEEHLIISLDTEAYKQALSLGITNRESAKMGTAIEITNFFSEVFPGDPSKGDFALYGYGINNYY